MKTFQTAISPLLIVLCLCGLGVFEHHGQPRLYLTIFYILISWLIYIYIIIKVRLFLQRFTIMLPMSIVTSIVFAVLNIHLNLFYNKKFKSCLKKLDIANNTLKKLGTPKNYAKLRMRIIWVIIGWIVSIFVMNMVDILRFFMIIPKPYTAMAMCTPLITNHQLHVNALYDLTFMTLLVYIGSQFEHINRHIQALTERKKRYVRHAWATFTSSLIDRHMAGTKTSRRIIWILMHIHFELCLVSRQLNMIFGLQMVMQAIAFHVSTVQLVNEFYHTVTRLNSDTPNGVRVHIFIIFVWATTGIIKMIIFNYICEKVCTKANQTEVHLNALTNLIFDATTQESITQFLLQLLRRPLKISGFRLFNFGYKFVFECVNYMAMIILFVIQTHPQEYEKDTTK